MTLDKFYRSFARTREEVIAPTDPPTAITSASRAETKSRVVIDESPETVEIDAHIVVLGRTEPGAECSFNFSRDGKIAQLQGITFADQSGHVFWLITIPSRMKSGPGIVTVTCGDEPDTVALEIISPEAPH